MAVMLLQNKEEGVYYLTLTGDATQDLVIDGEEVVLDLKWT